MTTDRRQCLSVLGSAVAASMTVPLGACRRTGVSPMPQNLAGGWVGAGVDAAHAWRDGRFSAMATGEPVRVHTLIVGAGVAGLSAARRLMDAGLHDLAVLDLEDHAGGNARGHQMAGLPCPLGAHYLPMPGADAHEVAQWLEQIGVIRSEHGRWVGDERYLCHSAHERLFVPDQGIQAVAEQGFWPKGQWQDGVLPQERVSEADREQYQRFSNEVARLQREGGFAMPTWRRPWNATLHTLDQVTFAQWLRQRGYTSPALLWLLDYACRDDYGAGLGRVSAWAGVHYFASRYGFEWPTQAAHDAVLTWPQGNAWLVDRLAAGLGARWHAAQVAVSVQESKHEVHVLAWSMPHQQVRSWVAQRVILAVPLFVARRLLARAVPALEALAPQMVYAPWLVSNLLIKPGFTDRPGVPMAWDNVFYTGRTQADLSEPSLGYVNARHQSLAPTPGAMLLTHYWALGGQSGASGQQHRRALLTQPWQHWAQAVLADLAQAHPDLPARVERMDLMRYGHAMAIPVPGARSHPARTGLMQGQGRLHFAHSDLSAYSVFEEAFTHGVRAADQVLRAAGMFRAMT